MTTTHEHTMLWMPTPIALPDEHRIFQATLHNKQVPTSLKTRPHELGHWAVADNSGDWPHTTDDGTLWLDFNSNIMIGNDASNPRIPILSPEGKSFVIVTNVHGLLVLTDMFRWTMNAGGKLYRTVRW
jgi:hypothetical protein